MLAGKCVYTQGSARLSLGWVRSVGFACKGRRVGWAREGGMQVMRRVSSAGVGGQSGVRPPVAEDHVWCPSLVTVHGRSELEFDLNHFTIC